MSDNETPLEEQNSYPMEDHESHPKTGVGRKILLAVAGIYVVASLFLMFNMQQRIGKLEAGQVTITQEFDTAQARSQGTADALAQKLGMTQRDLEARTADLQRQNKASVSKLAKEQSQQIEGVRSEVGSVKTDVGSVKTDVATTQSDLQATKDKLEHTIGDLGMQSGLIARTRDDLEMLKRRGERNYYEFTLSKGKHPVRVSTVSLQLKKADPKRGQYTLNVVADDRTIEKKDRTLFEPLQFYTGRDRQLYEVVVLSVDKSKITGYLSTPKELVAQTQQQQN